MPKVDRPRPTVDSTLANRAFAHQQYSPRDGPYSPYGCEKSHREYGHRHVASASPPSSYRTTSSRSRSPPKNRPAIRRDVYEGAASPTTPNELTYGGARSHVRLAPLSAGAVPLQKDEGDWCRPDPGCEAHTSATSRGPAHSITPILRLPPPGALCFSGQNRFGYRARDLKVTTTHELLPPTPTLPRVSPNTPCTPTRPFPERLLKMERDEMYSTGDFYLASSDHVLFVVQRHDLYASSGDFHSASEKTEFGRDGQKETARFIQFSHKADNAITLRMFLGLKQHGKLPDMHEETQVVVERVQNLFRFLRDWNCVVPMRLAKFCLEEMAKDGGINPLSALILASQLDFPDLFTIVLSRSARLMRPDVPGDDIYLGQPRMSILDPRGMSFINWTQITPTYQWAMVRAFNAAHPNPELSPDGGHIVAHFNHFYQLANARQGNSTIMKTITEPFSIEKRKPRVRPTPQSPFPSNPHHALRQHATPHYQASHSHQQHLYPLDPFRALPTPLRELHAEPESKKRNSPVHGTADHHRADSPPPQQQSTRHSHTKQDSTEHGPGQHTERPPLSAEHSHLSEQSSDEPRPETASTAERTTKDSSDMVVSD